jgi:hypothetical protein
MKRVLTVSSAPRRVYEWGDLEKFAPSLNARDYEPKLIALKSYAKWRSPLSVSFFSLPAAANCSFLPALCAHAGVLVCLARRRLSRRRVFALKCCCSGDDILKKLSFVQLR